jgi:hypothetical protein
VDHSILLIDQLAQVCAPPSIPNPDEVAIPQWHDGGESALCAMVRARNTFGDGRALEQLNAELGVLILTFHAIERLVRQDL